MRITILTTQRLTLETLDLDRFDALFALLSNANVHKYFPKTLTREESIGFLEQVQARQKEDGISFWAVIRKSDARMIGICGLLKQEIDGQMETEVAYRIDDQFWGNGYGTEAAAGCIYYARNALGLASVISLIRPVNTPSIRVAEKNSLTFEKETVFHDLVHRVYRIQF